jgi:(1->4)-alpha-D-glucan 1-alpha-D-glucosylmutase
MAKGFEDTSLYRYHRLVSLNDVGADPLQFGVSPSQFHCDMQKRVQHWPHSMLATSTHDSKRSEDVRARIDVLSEMPEAWAEHVLRWRKSNSRFKRQTATEMPTANDEYLFYQTLIGAWPLASSSANLAKDFSQRVTEYMLKAIREAKDATSWANPNQEYEAATADFVTAALDDELFLDDFVPFQRTISHFGMLNSLSQTLLKLTVPGVPDTYQGNELWEFNLVDPDNRRSVDYGMHLRLLDEIQASARFSDEQLLAYSQRLSENMNDGRIKMYVTWRSLTLRNLFCDAFRYGDYILLQARGAYADHVLAFTRRAGHSQFVVIVPRLHVRLSGSDMRLPTGSAVWQDTVVQLPENASSLRNVFTGERIYPSRGDRGCDLNIASALNSFPVALLTLQ